MNYFFSIVIPVYKVENYINQCIDSVLAQNFENYEIILVDDGSPDNSGKICDDYSSKYNNIKTIHKVNGGLSSARNAGAKKAEGIYLIFLDSDDYWNDNSFLENAYCFIEKNKEKKDLNVILFQSSKLVNNKIIKDKNYNCEYINNNNLYETVKYFIESETYSMSACTKIINKKLFISKNLFFTENLLGEDLDWFFKLIFNIDNIYAIDNFVYIYRIRQGSITTSIELKNIEDSIFILMKWSKYINKNIKNPNYKKTLFGILAYAYAVDLLHFLTLSKENRKKIRKKLLSLDFLLNYPVNKKIKIISIIYKFLGLNITSFLLKKIHKIKS